MAPRPSASPHHRARRPRCRRIGCGACLTNEYDSGRYLPGSRAGAVRPAAVGACAQRRQGQRRRAGSAVRCRRERRGGPAAVDAAPRRRRGLRRGWRPRDGLVATPAARGDPRLSGSLARGHAALSARAGAQRAVALRSFRPADAIPADAPNCARSPRARRPGGSPRRRAALRPTSTQRAIAAYGCTSSPTT